MMSAEYQGFEGPGASIRPATAAFEKRGVGRIGLEMEPLHALLDMGQGVKRV
jgi:hypothetical protein